MIRTLTCSFAAALVVLASGPTASAQPDPSGGGGPAGAQADAVTPPVLRSRADATYPPDALRDRLEGTVGLEVVVDETGAVIDARVTAPAGHGFDEAALAAVRKFTFEPARQDGAPIRSTVQLAYEFHPPPAPAPRTTMDLPPPPPGPPPPVPVQQGSDQSTLVARRPARRAHRRPARAQRRVRFEHDAGRALAAPALSRRRAARRGPGRLLGAARGRRQGAAGLRARLQPRSRHRHGVLRRRRAHQRREPRARAGVLGPALSHPRDRRPRRLDQGHLRRRRRRLRDGGVGRRSAWPTTPTRASRRWSSPRRPGTSASSSSSRPTSATGGAWSWRPRRSTRTGRSSTRRTSAASTATRR